MILLLALVLPACGNNCVPTEHIPVPLQWLPSQSCCAWLASISPIGDRALPLPTGELLDQFTMWGAAHVSQMFFDSPYFGGDARTPHWSRSMVDEYVANVKTGDFRRESYLGASQLIIGSLRAFSVRGLRGAVIGSEHPWVEAILLAEGAAHVTTIEFGRITTDHPDISTLTIPDLKRNISALQAPLFDFVMTYSSLEHSGLGRYGDALSPFADLEWIERLKCILRPGGFLYFGAPMSDADCLVWNAHRIYGPVRLAALEKGFRRRLLVGSKGQGCDTLRQPILVLQTEDAISTHSSFHPKDIAEARFLRQKWLNALDQTIEEVYNRLPTVSTWPTFDSLGHQLFDVLGPIAPLCASTLESYGHGDEEKRVCGLSRMHGPCTVVSIGSNNQWDFEEAIVRKTACRVVTFDCTCGTLRPPVAIQNRVTPIQICIGPKDFFNQNGWQFMTWQSALAYANVSHVAHLKMDIEGFEYDVLRQIVHHSIELAPDQISLELHYQTQMTDLAWHRRHKTPAEVALFIAMLFRNGDYFVIDRHDNPYCRHCSELVLARFQK